MSRSACASGAREIARIEFDGVLADRRQIEAMGEFVGDEFEQVGVEDRGRAAAPMDMCDLALVGMLGDQRDLFHQALRIGFDRFVAQRRLGVAAAVVANLAAEGDVQV